MTLRTSSSHEEGGERQWSVLTKEFTSDDQGNVTGLKIVDIEWKEVSGRMQFFELEGTERILACDLAFLAIGYTGPKQNGLLEAFGVGLLENSLPKSRNYQSTEPGVFLAGDMRRGQSLVVWAIAEGRECAVQVDLFLQGKTSLPERDRSHFSNVEMAGQDC